MDQLPDLTRRLEAEYAEVRKDAGSRRGTNPFGVAAIAPDALRFDGPI